MSLGSSDQVKIKGTNVARVEGQVKTTVTNGARVKRRRRLQEQSRLVQGTDTRSAKFASYNIETTYICVYVNTCTHAHTHVLPAINHCAVSVLRDGSTSAASLDIMYTQ